MKHQSRLDIPVSLWDQKKFGNKTNDAAIDLINRLTECNCKVCIIALSDLYNVIFEISRAIDKEDNS